MSDERFEQGLEIRREVLGREHVDRAFDNSFGRDFQHFMTEYCWGGCWGRETLERKTRSMVTLAILGTLGRMHEFETHFRAAFGNGCTNDELRDVLFHITIYAGVPAGVEAFRVAQKVLDEQD